MTFSAQTDRAAAPLVSDIAAALDWWRDAGVDFDFDDAPRDWLAEKAPAATAQPEVQAAAPPAPPPAPPAARIGGEPSSWPQTLENFAAWWLIEPSLDSGQVYARIAPRGQAGPKVMVLVDYPEASDTEELLSGDQGRLLNAILSAIGIAPEDAYVASLLPRHMPLPDWSALSAARLGELALHHAALVAPKRLITFGSNVSSLLGHSPAKSADPLQHFYHLGASIPALAAPGLDQLMARPRGKAALWRNLLDWQD